MKLKDLLTRIGVTNCTLRPGMSGDCEVILMPEESDGFSIKDTIYFDKDKQLWLIFDEDGDRWLTQDEDTGPLCEREGDMCNMPEVSGNPKCENPFCIDGMTELGPCARCNVIKQEEKPKIDICELSRHRAKRA